MDGEGWVALVDVDWYSIQYIGRVTTESVMWEGELGG